jgi:IS5 family transposase
MKPQRSSGCTQLQLFQSHFDQLLNLDHALVILADKIDWLRFETILEGCYCPDNGAPAKATRLLVGLHYLKSAFDLSDEEVVARWLENPYWQYFCGFTTMQHKSPLHPTTLVKWRNRVGETKMLSLLEETIALALREKMITPKELDHVTVDTTVQEKNITHPTDSKLYYKAIKKLVKFAKDRGIKLRQTYVRVGKKLALMAGRYAHARQFKRMKRAVKKLRNRLGRVIRDIQRKTIKPDQYLQDLLDLCERLHAQERYDKKKLYSLHEPEVVCISKGKARKKYEFGQKVSIVTSNRGNWVLSARLCEGNPYDAHTLAASMADAESNTGVKIKDAEVDRG